MTPYGGIDLGQHWLRELLAAAWRHQAITWTNVDLSSVRSCCIHLRVISQEMLEISLLDMGLKNTHLILEPQPPGANDLIKKGSAAV